jgi:hypothetical protein
MKELKRKFQAEVIGLPPLRMVLGEVPDPDPGQARADFRPFGAGRPASESKGTVEKLIGHLKSEKR